MISQHAKDGFDFLLQRAIRSSLAPAADDQCDVQPADGSGAIKTRQAVMLTISSYLFRVMVFIHFSPDAATKAHFARIKGCEPAELDDQTLLDVIMECGNICCGALNRDLGNYYPHVGMSTPCVLHRHCIEYIAHLKSGHTRHFGITINDALTLHASLAVCADADMDFQVDMTQAEESTGELEMF